MRLSLYWASFLLMLLFGSVAWAQNATSPVSVSISSQLPSPLRPNSRGNIVVKIKNVLQPRQPIQLTASVTYEYGDQTLTATSNTVTLQVVQPVVVRKVEIPIPVGIVFNNVTFHLSLNATLLEGEETSVTIPVTVN